MKREILYLYIAALLGAVLFLSSCDRDKLDSTSVIIESETVQNDFDRWLESNYRIPYNIDFKYRYEDIESDMSYPLVPARQEESIILAKLIKFLWLDAYSEGAGVHFLRTHVPRIMHVIGSAAWNDNQTMVLGQAEGGLKITLYVGNWLGQWVDIDEQTGKAEIDMDMVNNYYLHTIHHEFAHILHQKKDYPAEFKLISVGDYAPSSWHNRGDATSARLGFVSSYAGSEANEDFVETLSYYITWSEAEWQAKLDQAGTEGAAIIMRKLGIVINYMANTWNIDLDELRAILARRYTEVSDIDWVNL